MEYKRKNISNIMCVVPASIAMALGAYADSARVPEPKSEIREIAPKKQSLEQSVNAEIKSAFKEEEGWYTVSSCSPVPGEEPRVILIADNHDASKKSKDYLKLLDIVRKYSDSIGTEEGYQNKNPLEGSIEITNLVCEKEGKNERTNLELILREDASCKKIVDLGFREYSLEDRNLNITAHYIEYIFNELGGTKREVLSDKFIRFYNNIREEYLQSLPALNEDTLKSEEGFKKFYNEFIRVREELIDKRSHFAAGVIEDYIEEKDKEKPTAILYGAGHIPSISDELKRKNIPHIIIVNRKLHTSIKHPN